MQLSSFNCYLKLFSFPPPQIEVTHRIAWRRSFDNFSNCNPAARTLFADIRFGGGDLRCIQGCVGSISPTSFRCTDFSISEDWVSGIGINNYTLPAGSNTFEGS